MLQQMIRFNQSLRASRTDLPDLMTGDVVKVYRKIKEGGKERTQMFQGMVIAKKGGQSSSLTVTVRKVSSGVGVELILPLLSPSLEKIELVKRTKAGRSKLYYVRKKSAKVLGKKLREIPIAVGKAGVAVEEAMKEALQAEAKPAAVEPAPAEEKKGTAE